MRKSTLSADPRYKTLNNRLKIRREGNPTQTHKMEHYQKCSYSGDLHPLANKLISKLVQSRMQG